MPLDLKEHIASLKGNNSLQLNTIWVSCEGENPADQENIGPINYLPRRGFPGYFYPYENSEGYLSPLVAVHFVRPRSKYSLHLCIYAFIHLGIRNRHRIYNVIINI